MDDITTRTFIIAVNIFVTIAIVSIIVVMFFQIQNIYKVVASTDTSIYNRFDDIYSKYNGKTVTGIGLLNALKSFEESSDSEYVSIDYTDSADIRKDLTKDIREVDLLKKQMEENKDKEKGTFKYENRYSVTVTEQKDGKILIMFNKY